jgi:hypothetical protein
VALFGAAAMPGTAHAQLNTITGSGSTAGINTGFGGVIGQGSTLAVAQAAPGSSAISLTLNRGAGTLNDFGVIYIATSNTTGTGFTSTAGFNDGADATRAAISARGADAAATGRADLTFASGFTADYAIGFSTSQNFGGLWSLANGGANSLGFVTSVNLTPNNNNAAASFAMNFALSDIGLAPGQSFDYVVTYLNPFDNNSTNAFRSNEFNGVAAGNFTSGNIGVASATLPANSFNRFNSVAAAAVPEPGALALMAPAAMAGLLVVRRRRK